MDSVASVFRTCADAIRLGKLVTRESKKDKEFHFQNWFEKRLLELQRPYEVVHRNSFPDFIIDKTEGFELKSLASPGRWKTFDSNSHIASGRYNDRDIYYVFGRYPKTEDNTYPLIDLVICHGDFLNTDRDYIHHNTNIKMFSSYGDAMIRDRKMYVNPTPYGLIIGLEKCSTLIMPARYEFDLIEVGHLVRRESEYRVIGYSVDLITKKVTPTVAPNPNAGKEHQFRVWRDSANSTNKIIMRG